MATATRLHAGGDPRVTRQRAAVSGVHEAADLRSARHDEHVVSRRLVADRQGLADYYARRGTGFARQLSIENVYGNGGLLTTVDDLLKWNRNFDRPIVGDAAFVDALQERARFTDGGTHEYALGLYVDTYQGVREVDHSGGGLGTAGHLGRYPDQQVSVAIMCNLDGANVTGMAKSVARLCLTGLRPAPEPASTHALTTEEASRVTGLYRSKEPVGSLTVEYAKGRLRVPTVHDLVPQSATRFVTSDVFTYEFDGRGGLRTTDEFGRVIVYERVEPVRPSPAELRALAGRYTSDEVNTTLELVVDEGTLIIRRLPDWNIRLTAVSADAFRGDLGWITFERDAFGQVIRLNVSQDHASKVSRIVETYAGHVSVKPRRSGLARSGQQGFTRREGRHAADTASDSLTLP